MIHIESSCKMMVMMIGCIMVLLMSGCVGGLNNKIIVTYTEHIQKNPGGVDDFWPEKSLKIAFLDYWNLRYSDLWRNAYEKEAPYFQEIVGRDRYEGVIKGTVMNRLDGIEIRSIQKVSSYFYEIQIIINILTAKNEKKESYFTDRWVYVGNNWYHVMRDPLLFSNAS